MASFNADAIEKIDWNFRPYVEADGVVPEPSTEQVGVFLDTLHALITELAATGEFDDIPEADIEKMKRGEILALAAQKQASNQRFIGNEKLIAAYADLCSNLPSVEQLAALPHRIRERFFNHVRDQFVNPI